MKALHSLGCLLLACSLWSFQAAATAPAGKTPVILKIKVWPGAAPGSEIWTQKETETKALWGDRVVRNVVDPSLDAYLPDPAIATGAGVIVCPGGAFRFLSIDTEGVQVAQWLQGKGIAAFLLRYRLGETAESDAMFSAQIFGILAPLFRGGDALLNDMKLYGGPAIADGRQALSLVRERAKEFGLKPDRIGMLGFSAGGVVATGVAIEHDAASRPDFFAAVYPGPWPIASVPTDAPPLFIAAAADDGITLAGSKPLEAAWRAAGKPVEAHIYDKGGHGFGMKKQGKPSDAWTDHLLAWFEGLGLLKRAA